VADLEQDLGGLRADSAAGQATVAQLRTRIGEAERHSQWLPLLAAAVALLAVAALWLGLRLRALQLERRTLLRQFAASRQPAAESSSFDTSSGFVPARAVQAGLQVAEAPAAVAAALSSVKRPGDLALDSESQPALWAVSADELIDLEQQVEFFMILGQEESAVGLLVAHLGRSGGASPLPYLRLLEIHQRRNDREAYGRTVARLQRRFGSGAPEWLQPERVDHGLLGDADVVEQMQAAWPSAQKAMAALEALLFPAKGARLLGLSVYRDALVLYAVARDLHAHEASDTVDLLLPLSAEGDASRAQVDLELGFDAGAQLRDSRFAALPAFSAPSRQT
jgi:hypothetical protein